MKLNMNMKDKRWIGLGCILVVLLIVIICLVLIATKKIDINTGGTGNDVESTSSGTTPLQDGDNNVGGEKINSVYIKDKKVGSYIWFSGSNWIVLDKANDGIVLISVEPIAILNYNDKDNNYYNLSYLRHWLNEKYYKTLNNKALLMPQTFVWRQNEDGTENTVTDYIGILTKESYMKNKDMLNISKYNWTMSAPLYFIDQAYCITNSGNLETAEIDSKYGVSPIIKISNKISLRGGDGTKASPYKLEQEYIAKVGEKLNNRHSGEYISYSGLSWRIVDVNPNLTTKLVSNNVIWFEGFDTRNVPTYYPDDKYNIGNYLNTVFYNNLENKEWIAMADWYLKDFGYVPPVIDPKNPSQFENYIEDPNNPVEKPIEQIRYERNKVESISTYVGLLKFGDLLTTTDIDADWWLITQPNNSSTKLYYIYYLSGIISQADAFTKFPARPAINLDKAINITGGEGTKNNPYTISK
ncbi:MAG TPA: hypothetical protein DEP72_08085 [Clostridiales bacterium]|nr:MAG: hypothetical protein A2Y18_01210 [Clostridiales bacterium GWD2_32_19]HCC08095.1 hypothetical protein [Clostridiales bacterium]